MLRWLRYTTGKTAQEKSHMVLHKRLHVDMIWLMEIRSNSNDCLYMYIYPCVYVCFMPSTHYYLFIWRLVLSWQKIVVKKFRNPLEKIQFREVLLLMMSHVGPMIRQYNIFYIYSNIFYMYPIQILFIAPVSLQCYVD